MAMSRINMLRRSWGRAGDGFEGWIDGGLEGVVSSSHEFMHLACRNLLVGFEAVGSVYGFRTSLYALHRVRRRLIGEWTVDL